MSIVLIMATLIFTVAIEVEVVRSWFVAHTPGRNRRCFYFAIGASICLLSGYLLRH